MTDITFWSFPGLDIYGSDEGAEAPDGRWERPVPGLCTTNPLYSCEDEAMAGMMTVRLAELINARIEATASLLKEEGHQLWWP